MRRLLPPRFRRSIRPILLLAMLIIPCRLPHAQLTASDLVESSPAYSLGITSISSNIDSLTTQPAEYQPLVPLPIQPRLDELASFLAADAHSLSQFFALPPAKMPEDALFSVPLADNASRTTMTLEGGEESLPAIGGSDGTPFTLASPNSAPLTPLGNVSSTLALPPLSALATSQSTSFDSLSLQPNQNSTHATVSALDLSTLPVASVFPSTTEPVALVGLWTSTFPPSAPIPEPGSLSIFTLALFAFRRPARRR